VRPLRTVPALLIPSGDLESKILAVFLVPAGTTWITSREPLCLSEPHHGNKDK
jgi:hypothetical protein